MSQHTTWPCHALQAPTLSLAIVAALACGSGCKSQAAFNSAKPAAFPQAVVSADHSLASEAGAEVMRKHNGNAVDAAVATSFALSVLRPDACGIGGGGFMVIHFNRDRRHGTRSIALNYREKAPAAVTADYFDRLEAKGAASPATRGATSVGVPGTVAGLLYALDHFGTLDRSTVLAPAIRLAENGFPADRTYVDSLAGMRQSFKGNPQRQLRSSFVWKRMLREGQLQVGDVVTLPEKAEALRLIAETGVTAFYEGPIAREIVETVREGGGHMTLNDLRDYRVDRAEPVRFDAMGRRFLSMPPPSSGGVALAQVYGILQRVRAQWDSADPAAQMHVQVESLKHAFADRAKFMGDPAFASIPVTRLTSDRYLDELAARVDQARTLESNAYGAGETSNQAKDDGGTSHFSVVDARGNAVACTETVFQGFGSHVFVEKYGILLNNTLGAFTQAPGQPNVMNLIQSDANLPGPGKRPLASMTPTIVLDRRGRVEAVAGAAGGPLIISATFQVLDHALREQMTAEHALREQQFHHQWRPDVLLLEPRLFEDAQLVDALRARGHNVRRTGKIGYPALIRRDRSGTGWDAASDSARGGEPAGF